MQRPRRPNSHEARSATFEPLVCPLRKVATSPARCRRARRGVSFTVILVSILIVALATVAVASTMLAMKMRTEKTRAEDDLALASRAVDQYVAAVATNKQLKGAALEPVRRELFEQALKYYQDYVKSHEKDRQPSLGVAAANYHIVALQAKLGSPDSVQSLVRSMDYLDKLNAAKIDPAEYPSLQEFTLKLTSQSDWITLQKGVDLNKHLFGMVIALATCDRTLGELSRQSPQAVVIRDDLSAILAASATLQSAVGSRRENALDLYTRAIAVLETLVRDQPASGDFKTRLLQCLDGAVKLHKANKDFEKALAVSQRAVEVREQLAAAAPDDTALAKDLTTAKADLEKLKLAAAEKKAAAPAVTEAKDSKEPPPAGAEAPPAGADAPPAAADAPPAASEVKDGAATASP